MRHFVVCSGNVGKKARLEIAPFAGIYVSLAAAVLHLNG